MPILYKFQIKSFMGLSISQQKSTNAMKMDAVFHGDKRKEKYSWRQKKRKIF